MSKADENQPTEEQVKEANAAEEARWQDDFPDTDLSIPYKSVEKKDEKTRTTSDNDADEDVEDAKVQEVYEDPEPVLTVKDPGKYKPADYSFEVTLADGKTKTIRTTDEADTLAEDPDNFETPKQLLDFIRKSQKMEHSQERDLEKWEASKEKFDEQSASEKQRQETVSGYAGEFDYLASKGLIPKLSKELQSADWRDPKISKDKDVKVYNSILDYLIKENKVRAKAGVKPMTSIVDAFNAWQLDTGRQKQEDDKKAAGQARKDAGSKVSGVSPTQQGSYVPKGIAVGNPNVFKRSVAVWDD